VNNAPQAACADVWCGEIGIVGLSAAVANAVHHARAVLDDH
jgi:hypothetical protein